MAYTRKQFIEIIGPLAQKDATSSKILASLTIAQAILESNNGNSTLTKEANALFGIKATNWKGRVWTGKTLEYYNSNNATTITAGFRAYNSWQESINDHSKLLTTSSRYKKLIGEKDYQRACKCIAECGYATDPLYASKLILIIQTNKLYEFDEEPKEAEGSDYVVEKKKIQLNGVVKEVNAINIDGNNYIKLQDLADNNIQVSYDTDLKIPVISSK